MLQQGLWAEHWTATDSNNPWDKYNLVCVEERLEECLEENKILAIDTESQDVIVCIGTVGERGAVTFMFQDYEARLPETTKKIIQRERPLLICDHINDWAHITDTPEG